MIPLLYSVAARLAPPACRAALAYALARASRRARSGMRTRRGGRPCARTWRGSRPRSRRARAPRWRGRMFANFAESLVDSWRAERGGAAQRRRSTIEGDERLRAAVARGRRRAPVERAPRQLGARGRRSSRVAGFAVRALARPQPTRALERWFARRRPRPAYTSSARCPGATKRGACCARTGSSRSWATGASSDGGRAVPFFGRLARLPAAPLALARRTGAARRARLRRAHGPRALPRAPRARARRRTGDGALRRARARHSSATWAPIPTSGSCSSACGTSRSRDRVTTRPPVSFLAVLVPAYNAARRAAARARAPRARPPAGADAGDRRRLDRRHRPTSARAQRRATSSRTPAIAARAPAS